MLFKNHLVFRIMQKIKILLFFYGTFSVMELFKIELIYVRNDNVKPCFHLRQFRVSRRQLYRRCMNISTDKNSRDTPTSTTYPSNANLPLKRQNRRRNN